MGRKNVARRDNFFVCIAVVILLFTLSCSSFREMQRRQYTREMLLRSEKLLEEKDFDGALMQNRKVLSLYVKGPPGDRALFNIAMIYLHNKNPDRDKGKALDRLRKLLHEYPDSQLVVQAKNWENILAESTRLELALSEKNEALDQFLRSKSAVMIDNFREALEANNKILSLSDSTLPKDRALYTLAVIYAHGSNPDRNYQKTLHYFSRLIDEYPDSPYSNEAKVWSSVIQVIEQAKQIDIEIEKKKKEMER